jgi:hypothetical protein
MSRTTDHGGFVKKEPAERLVSEEHDRGAHIEQAIGADFPFLGDRYELSKTCQAATTTMLSMEGELNGGRGSWLNGGRGKYERSR